jgi:hypothetical protein
MLPRLDGFFTVFIMSIIMLSAGKSSVETMIRWIDQPFLAPFLPCVAPPDREAFRAEVIERTVQATRCRRHPSALGLHGEHIHATFRLRI